MTEGNIKDNIKAELERAYKAMEATDLLFKNGFLNLIVPCSLATGLPLIPSPLMGEG